MVPRADPAPWAFKFNFELLAMPDTNWPARLVIIAMLCGASLALPAIALKKPVNKLVSINLCTDELALALAKPGQLISVSYISRDSRQTVYARKAAQLPVNYGQAEELIALNPDLIISSQYSSRYSKALLEKLGHNLLELPLAHSINDLYRNITLLANALQTEQRGKTLITSIKAEIATIEKTIQTAAVTKKTRPTVLVYRLGGWISKPPELLDELIQRAGGHNLARSLGQKNWVQITLESIVRLNPDYLIIAHSGRNNYSFSRHFLNHPVFSFYKNQNRLISIPSAWINCGNPALTKALKKIAFTLHSQALELHDENR